MTNTEINPFFKKTFQTSNELKPGAALTVRPVRLEPHQYFRFTNRGHFFKSPKYAIKNQPKKCTPSWASSIFQSLRQHCQQGRGVNHVAEDVQGLRDDHWAEDEQRLGAEDGHELT